MRKAHCEGAIIYMIICAYTRFFNFLSFRINMLLKRTRECMHWKQYIRIIILQFKKIPCSELLYILISVLLVCGYSKLLDIFLSAMMHIPNKYLYFLLIDNANFTTDFYQNQITNMLPIVIHHNFPFFRYWNVFEDLVTMIIIHIGKFPCRLSEHFGKVC